MLGPHKFVTILALGLLSCTGQTGPESAQVSTSPSATGVDPQPEPLVEHWTDLSVGGTSGCVVGRYGELWCWGNPPVFDAPSWRPQRIPGPGVEPVRSVAVNYDWLCVIDHAEQVHCTTRADPWWTIDGVEHPSAIEVGSGFACATQADRTTKCWNKPTAPPQTIAMQVHALVVNGWAGCVLQAEGAISCWSYPMGEKKYEPKSVGHIPGAIDIGGDLSNNALWVLDDHGRVFVNTSTRLEAPLQWTQIGDVPGAIEISGSHHHACVRTGSGDVWCAGENDVGQLGNGSSMVSDGFVKMDASQALEIGVGVDRSCARTHDAVVCAGLDWFRQRAASTEPVQHTLPGLVATDLAADVATTCATTSSSGMRCWGSKISVDHAAELGLGIEVVATPTLIAEGVTGMRGIGRILLGLVWVGADGRPRQLKWHEGRLSPVTVDRTHAGAVIRELASGFDLCAIEERDGGTALVCGDWLTHWNPIAGVDGPVALAIASTGVCAIDRRAKVACAGLRGAHDPVRSEPFAARIRGVENVSAIAMSDDDACAVDAAGRVSCWSWRTELVQTADGDQLHYRSGPVAKVGLSDVRAIVGVSGHQAFGASKGGFCSLDGAGAVLCWMPDGAGITELAGPTLDTEAVEIVAGWNHVCARGIDGAVTCWGDESQGQLGRVPLHISLRPDPVITAESR